MDNPESFVAFKWTEKKPEPFSQVSFYFGKQKKHHSQKCDKNTI